MAAALAFVVSVPLMLPVRSMTSMTSTGVSGDCPHGPLQATEVTTPVDPLLTPTTRPKVKGVVAAPATTTTLHLSPTEGSQEVKRLAPAPAKSAATGARPSEWLGSHTAGMSREMYGLGGTDASAPTRHL